MALPSPLLLLTLLFLLQSATSDFAADQSECADKLVALSTCLTYVEGNAKTPTPDCCSGLKTVISTSPKCLCILVRDRDNPQLGLKINANLALGLPSICGAPANISDCPRLLKLPPNSKDALIFKQFGDQAAGKSGSVGGAGTGKGNSTGGTSATASSGERVRIWWGGMMMEMVVVVVLLPILVVFNG